MYSSFRKNFLPIIPKRLKMSDISQNPGVIRKLFAEMIGSIESRGDRADNVVMNVKKVLNPVFDYAIENPSIELHQNPLRMKSTRDLLRRFSADGKKERLFQRVDGDYVEVAQGVIVAARQYSTQRTRKISTDELRLFFLLAVSTARRTEELLRLKMSDIDIEKRAIFARSETTKNAEGDIYPIPSEVVALLPARKTGLLFSSVDANAYGKHFSRMLSNADLPMKEGKRLTGHDRRKLFASIMTREIGDSDVVDALISHKDSMKMRYVEFSLEDRRKIFSRYWELIGIKD
jgi:integrase